MPNRPRRPFLVLAIIALLTTPRPASAERQTGPWVDLPVCTVPGWRFGPALISDGRQGVIVAWYDSRTLTDDLDIYAQRLNPAGRRLWPIDGVALTSAPGERVNVKLATDDEGGAYAAWTDDRGGFVGVQRIQSDGSVAWAENGIIAAPNFGGANPRIAPDGHGDALLAWEWFGFSGRVIVAQLVDRAGHRLWGDEGVIVATLPPSLYGPGPSIVSDGAGGAFVAWTDKSNATWKAVVQHVAANGTLLWAPAGIRICHGPSDQHYCVLVGDGAGHAIAAWKDSRSAGVGTFGVLAQRFDAAGHLLWSPDGVPLDRQAESDDLFPEAVADGDGAIVAWHDRRTGEYDVYAQSVDGNGGLLWGDDAPAVCTAPNDQIYPAIAATGSHEAIVAWEDYRASPPAVYAQTLDRTGRLGLGEAGALVSTGGYGSEPVVATDGRLGGFVVWADSRRFPQTDMTAQRILARGDPGAQSQPTRNELSRPVALSWNARASAFSLDLQAPARVEISIFDVLGRRCSEISQGDFAAGAHIIHWDGRDRAGRRLSPGVYYVRATTGASAINMRVVLLP